MFMIFAPSGWQVMVKMRNLDNNNEWMFDRHNFINRKYLMQEMYQNYMEGSPDWDVEQVAHSLEYRTLGFSPPPPLLRAVYWDVEQVTHSLE